MINILSNLVDELPVGVIVLDVEGRAVVYSATEARLSGRPREDVLGRDFFREHGVCMDVPAIAGVFREKVGREPFFAEADFSFPFPFLSTPREVRVRLTSFEANGAPYGLLVIRDVAFERSVDLMRQTLNQMIVHDLKNPLTAVASSLSFLEERANDDADALAAIADAREACRRIESILLNLLDSARLETNALPLTRREVDVSLLAAKAAELARAAARSAPISIEVMPAPLPALAIVDPDIVLRILQNLLDNALRFGSRVTVSTEVGDDRVVVAVADDGPGIPLEAREKIFEKYARVGPEGSHARARNQGLGLTFVQLAARAHGGDTTVDCPPSGGTIFRVVLPVHRSR